MIQYTVEAALASRLFEKVIVSTDDLEIADISRDVGAEVPFTRAASLADDSTPVSAVTLDVLERCDPDGSRFDSVAQLMANCPLRTADDIRASYDRFNQSGALSQISVTRFGWLNPWWAMTMDAKGKLTPLNPEAMTNRSQDLPMALCPTGAIWWARTVVLRREKTFHINGRTGWEMPWQRAVDIDDEEDLRMADLLMKARLTGEDV